MRRPLPSCVGLAAVAVVVAVASVAIVATSPSAGADCSGPTVEHTGGAVDRGGHVTVTGTSFGENCYDTGPPPPGQGVLGVPITGIKVLFVQGADEVVVAEGDADDGYRFEVDVAVPATLAPGPVSVAVRWGAGGEVVAVVASPLVVTDAAPVGGGVAEAVTRFGPVALPPEAAVPADGGGRGALPVVAGVGAVVGLLALAVSVGVRRLGRRAP